MSTPRASLKLELEKKIEEVSNVLQVGPQFISPVYFEGVRDAYRAVLTLLDAEPEQPKTVDSRGYVLPEYVAVVATEAGGVQLEGHTHEQDWEVTLDAKGNVQSWSLDAEPEQGWQEESFNCERTPRREKADGK